MCLRLSLAPLSFPLGPSFLAPSSSQSFMSMSEVLRITWAVFSSLHTWRGAGAQAPEGSEAQAMRTLGSQQAGIGRLVSHTLALRAHTHSEGC